MGYRSDVFIAIKKEVYDQEMLLGVGRDEWFHNAARLNEENVYYWSFEGTKWSDIYPECAYVINLIDLIALSEGGEDKFAFARTGDDGEDTEEMGNLEAFDIEVVQYQSAYIETNEPNRNYSPLRPTLGEQNATAAA
jgi:hypothetical protein